MEDTGLTSLDICPLEIWATEITSTFQEDKSSGLKYYGVVIALFTVVEFAAKLRVSVFM